MFSAPFAFALDKPEKFLLAPLFSTLESRGFRLCILTSPVQRHKLHFMVQTANLLEKSKKGEG